METRYYLIWRNRFLTLDAERIEDMIAALDAATQQLREMQEAGVSLDGGTEDDYAYLVTEDEAVAIKYGFEEEEDDDDDDDESEYDDEEENEEEEGDEEDEEDEDEDFYDEDEDDEYEYDEDYD